MIKKIEYNFCVKNVIVIVCVLLGSFIGAGFISGKEIATFFTQFGWVSVITSLLACAIIAVNIYIEFNRNSSYNDGKLSKITNLCYYLCSFVVATAMLAGLFKLSFIIFSGAVAAIVSGLIIAICFILIVKGITSLSKINVVFIFLAVTLIIIICCQTIKNGDTALLETRNVAGGFLFGLVYAGMNSLTIIPVTRLLKNKIKQKAEAKSVAILFFIVSGSLILGINLIVSSKTSMPMLDAAASVGGVVKVLYIVAIFMGLITSLLSTSIVVKEKIKLKLKDNFVSSSIVLATTLVVSTIGFDSVVELLYPIIGVIGMVIVMVDNIYAQIKNRKIYKK